MEDKINIATERPKQEQRQVGEDNKLAKWEEQTHDGRETKDGRSELQKVMG